MGSTDNSLDFSRLTFAEKLCAVCVPVIVVVEALIYAASGCFRIRELYPSKKLRYDYDDLVRLANESRFSVNEIEALLELFMKFSISIIDNGLIHKEELQLALFKTPRSENLLLDRVFYLFNEKKIGVIEFEKFIHALNVFHPYAPMTEKIDWTLAPLSQVLFSAHKLRTDIVFI